VAGAQWSRFQNSSLTLFFSLCLSNVCCSAEMILGLQAMHEKRVVFRGAAQAVESEPMGVCARRSVRIDAIPLTHSRFPNSHPPLRSPNPILALFPVCLRLEAGQHAAGRLRPPAHQRLRPGVHPRGEEQLADNGTSGNKRISSQGNRGKHRRAAEGLAGMRVAGCAWLEKLIFFFFFFFLLVFVTRPRVSLFAWPTSSRVPR
jgi:hypothetical protein